MRVSERGIAADEQNFHGPVLQRFIDLSAPSVARLKRQDVGEHAVPLGLKLGREPERKLIVDRRGLDQKYGVSRYFLDRRCIPGSLRRWKEFGKNCGNHPGL
ncbi:hypothetical protein ACVI8K_007614 [Bradyrhizobium barranii subsp. barranii]